MRRTLPAPAEHEHLDVSAYAVGALGAAETQRYERHLAGCQRCRMELELLVPLVTLMSYVDPAVLAAPLEPTARRRPVHSRRLRTAAGRWMGTVAAGIVLVLTAGVTGALLATRTGSDQPAATVAAAGSRHHAVDPATGVDATVLVAARQWGSEISLQLSRVGGPQTCRLVAVSTSGQRETIVGWRVPVAGYGTPEHPAALVLGGATYLSGADIGRFEVRTSSDVLLVSVPG
jgi:hypothetical protein